MTYWLLYSYLGVLMQWFIANNNENGHIVVIVDAYTTIPALLRPNQLMTTTRTRSFILPSSSLLSSKSSRYTPSQRELNLSMSTDNNNNDNNSGEGETEAERLRRQAEVLREQIRDMELKMGSKRRLNNNDQYIPKLITDETDTNTDTESNSNSSPLKGKRILVIGANGRLGSMVCRYLLRTYGTDIKECVAAVHTVSENSATSRGYGRLSYEVGAEDGIGSITPAWQVQDNIDGSTSGSSVQFQFNVDVMSGYNLNKIRIVECELLDPVQCRTITTNIDTIIWCATDFNGNTPRSISTLNLAFLFRSISRPNKGRVEIEGLQNILNAFTFNRQQQRYKQQQQQQQLIRDTGTSSPSGTNSKKNNILDFVLVSMMPGIYDNFETPFGEFNAMKRQGEQMLLNDYPTLRSTVLQMACYEDNFVQESMPIITSTITSSSSSSNQQIDNEQQQQPKFINRRDAAKATVDSILNDDQTYSGNIIQVHTATKRR